MLWAEPDPWFWRDFIVELGIFWYFGTFWNFEHISGFWACFGDILSAALLGLQWWLLVSSASGCGGWELPGLCSLCLPMPPNYVKPSESVANRPPKPTQTALKNPKISLRPTKMDIYSVKLTPLLAKETSLILTPKHTNNLNTRAISCVLHGFHQVCPDFNLCPSCEQNCIDGTSSKLKLKQLQNSKAVYWQPSLGIQANSALSC